MQSPDSENSNLCILKRCTLKMHFRIMLLIQKPGLFSMALPVLFGAVLRTIIRSGTPSLSNHNGEHIP